MFNEDDFKNLEDSMEGMPDGLVDASDYTEDMELITDILSKIDYDNMMSRMEAMMYIINMKNKNDNTKHERILRLLKSRGGRGTHIHSTIRSYNRSRDKATMKKYISE